MGIISLFENNNTAFDLPKQFQIRGMAVLEQFQKRGLGEELIRYTENRVRQKNGQLIWFNARETAVGFYQKLGYAITGEAFEIPTAGTHYIMSKKVA
ncbi:GNAT family N-acetyltransferase [Flavobacterium kingsejongi]|uniref:GNAT family N-acetyltransferase n=1 Tax=Flavobacterium kingsejongi TaxID=1678728 RepID=UPI0021D3BA29|nr:GNAT family N-acetyltransferase [Flavobacterium kingsejongi]